MAGPFCFEYPGSLVTDSSKPQNQKVQRGTGLHGPIFVYFFKAKGDVSELRAPPLPTRAPPPTRLGTHPPTNRPRSLSSGNLHLPEQPASARRLVLSNHFCFTEKEKKKASDHLNRDHGSRRTRGYSCAVDQRGSGRIGHGRRLRGWRLFAQHFSLQLAS